MGNIYIQQGIQVREFQVNGQTQALDLGGLASSMYCLRLGHSTRVFIKQ